MSPKLRRSFMLAAVLLLAALIFPNKNALALCNRTGGSGGNDIILCSNPPDPDGISTSWGDDQITVAADTTVYGTNSVHAGTDNDIVYNYGQLLPSDTGIFMSTGTDRVYNYGTIISPDDGIWCTPQDGDTCTVNNYGMVDAHDEAMDLNIQGGTFILNNEGTFRSRTQEGVHLHGGPASHITNSGTIHSYKSGMETYGGYLHLTNSGTVYSEHEMAVNTGGQDDVILNSGTIQSNFWFALGLSSGADHVTNHGRLISRNANSGDSVVDLGYGEDTLITSGDILENGAASRAVKLGGGNDTLTIQGGNINKPIDGGTERDVLIFEFSGSQSEIDEFRARIASQGTSSGSATWRGNTYRWQNFEEIRLNLTSTGGSTATPTPPATATAAPTTPAPTATGTPSQVLEAGYYEENHAAILYSGTWTRAVVSQASGGEYKYTSSSAAKYNFSFNGTTLTLIRRIDTNRGDMQVCIDGACQTVSNHSPTRLWQQPVSFTVTAGTHTVEVRNSGGDYMDLDAVRVEMSSGSTPTPTPIPPTSTVAPTTEPTTPAPTSEPTATPTLAPSATAGCPPSAPAAVTARKHDPLNGSRTLTVEWEDVGADPCMGVTHYVIYASYGSYAQQWTANRADASCTGAICQLVIVIPDTVSRLYWRVEAYNALGTGGSDNLKRWDFSP